MFCAITTLFNSASRFAHYQVFRERLTIPLFTVELALGDQPFLLTPQPNIIQVRSESVLWHKERLLNIGLQQLPDEFDQVAWLDADISFDRADWAEQACQKLEHFPVLQLFNEVRETNPSTGQELHSQGQIIHPGFAWAARREVLDGNGFWDRGIAGCGDALMMCAFFGSSRNPFLKHFSLPLLEDLFEWGRKVYRKTDGNVGYLEGCIEHFWHGSKESRQYIERLRIIKSFDPKVDLTYNADSCWEWSDLQNPMHIAIKEYFEKRDQKKESENGREHFD